MLVRDFMTAAVVITGRDARIADAARRMQTKRIRRLPVLDGTRLGGIVTWTDLARTSPLLTPRSAARSTAASVDTIRVGDVMTPNPLTVAPDTTIEHTAVLMREHKIGGLPVMEHGVLAGIITESDVFEAFIRVMGLRSGGTRLTIRQNEAASALADIVNTVRACDAAILSLATYRMHDTQWTVVRVAAPYALHVVQTLVERGINVTHLAPLPQPGRDDSNDKSRA